jgi:hypothetical protein
MQASARAMIIGPDTTPPGRARWRRVHADFVSPRKVFANDRVEVGDADFRTHEDPLPLLEEHA